MDSNISKVTYWGSRLALTLSVLVGGCDVFGEGERYLEGEVIPGSTRSVLVNVHSFYNPGRVDPSVSPDGRFVAFHQPLDDGLSLRVLDTETGEVCGLTRGFGPDWSPDGVWIAFYDGAAVYKIRVDGSERTALATEGRSFVPDWSPDGSQVAYDRSLADESGPAGVWVMNADGSDKRPLGGGRFPDWHPDEQRLLALRGLADGSSEEVVVYDAQDGREQGAFVLPSTDFSYSHPQYSPDGSRLVYGAPDGIWVAAAGGSWARRILPNHLYNPDYDGKRPTLAVSSPSWHPDGQRIVYEHLAITAYDDNPSGLGPVVQGEASLRLLDVDAALEASNL